jgi:hypothetical protein
MFLDRKVFSDDKPTILRRIGRNDFNPMTYGNRPGHDGFDRINAMKRVNTVSRR